MEHTYNPKAQRILSEIKKAVVGKDDIAAKILMALLAQGHVLLDDIPGVGKTTLAMAFSKALSLDYHRMQFTPDVMPSDITGFTIYNKQLGDFEYKPGAAVVSARRGGTTAALDALNKYFTINCMPVVSSKYWNMVHGNTPDEVRQDLEGMQVMRTLGRNMAWLLKCIEIGRAAGITAPEPEPPVRTNFIR